MTMNLLTILLALFIVISIVGDIIIARKLNKHEEEYKAKYDELINSFTNTSKEVKSLSDRYDNLYVPYYNKVEDLISDIKNINSNIRSLSSSISSLNNNYNALDKSITSLQESEKENNDSIVMLKDKVNKLSEPEQATKEQILQVLDEQNVLISSIKDGTVILEEK